MNVLEIKNLCKKYEKFHLKNVSFNVEKGKIMGFIGRNGAGKSTTLKSLLNFVHPDSGEVLFFNKDFNNNEFEIKQRIGFVSGGIDYYSKSKLNLITKVTKKFYDNWNEEAYKNYINMFKIDENKTPEKLSAGMKVKYSIALALSHNAELLILDEPTSGLDPVSRDELLDVFLDLVENGVSILFSTHITSDLDKCADDITYIKNGKIISSESMNDFVNKYRTIDISKDELTEDLKTKLIGCKKSKNGYTAIIKAEDEKNIGVNAIKADLESIMVHLEKEEF